MADRKPKSLGRTARASMFSAGILLVTALFLMVNYLGWKYHKRFDWTASEIYTLSEKSLRVLAELEKDVEIVVFMQPNDELYPPVQELLARYEAASSRISLREVDPSRNLAEAQAFVDRHGITDRNVILLQSGEDRLLVETDDIADYDYSGLQFGQAPTMTGFKGEQSFTAGLLALTQSERAKVLFTTGHGEAQLSDFAPTGLSGAQELLERDNYEVEAWASLGQAAVPDNTELVVIAGPTGNFVEPELAALSAYIDGGGSLMILLDPTLSPSGGLIETGLEDFLDRRGVIVGDDIVVDPANPLPFFGADTIFVNDYGTHEITTALQQAELPTILALARSVRLAEDIDGYETATLLSTTDEGWGERNLDDLGAVRLDDDDLVGPVALGVALRQSEADATTVEGSEGAPAAPASRLVVIGDADLATNAQLRNTGNLTLLSNALNWLAERDALIAIPPKTPESVRLSLTSGQMRGIFWFVVLGLPALVVAVGVYVHRRRRS